MLSRDEVWRVLDAQANTRLRVCLTTIYACGLRLMEGIRLQVPDIDGERTAPRSPAHTAGARGVRKGAAAASPGPSLGPDDGRRTAADRLGACRPASRPPLPLPAPTASPRAQARHILPTPRLKFLSRKDAPSTRQASAP